MAFVAAFLKERLDGLGKDRGVGSIFLFLLGVFLSLFRHLDGIPLTASLRFITLKFIPGARAQPQYRYHQQADITDEFIVL